MAVRRPSFLLLLVMLLGWLQVLRVNSLEQDNQSSSNLDHDTKSSSSNLEQDTVSSGSTLEQDSISSSRLEQNIESNSIKEYNKRGSSSWEQDIKSSSVSLEQDTGSSRSSSLEQDIRDQIVADLGLGRLPDIARVSTL
jgi:hypothetical protein